MKIKKLIIFFPIFNRGGLEQVANYLLENLEFSKISVLFITYRKNKYLNENNKKIKIIAPTQTNKNFSNFKKLIFCTYELIKLLKKNSSKDTVILSLQNNSISILIAKIFNYKIIIKNATPIEALLYLNNIFKTILVFFAKIITYNLANKIIVNSKSNMISLSKFIYNKKKIKLIYNPVNLKNRKFFNKKNKKYILTVSRLVYEKGIHILIKAFKKIKKQDYKLIIVGDGVYKKKLIKLVKSLKLQKKVVFTGWINNPEKFYLNSKLFILPSFFEGFGNVLIEAMNLKVPCISTLGSGSPKEILGNGKYGYLVQKQNVDELTKKINYCLENPRKIKKKAGLAKKSLARFQPAKSINKYILEINSIL
tara:strand:- start:13358 stop:14455 length:1098 start_codon:yes stop_codon:yes gene_type:complete